MCHRIVILICFAVSLSGVSAFAQELDSLTKAYPPTLCSSCADWNAPQDPFRVYANTYYVGTRGLSSMLITSPEGHVLIDGALPNSAPVILENVRELGFEPADIKLILNSHAHFDHAGGIAAIQRVTEARVAASPESASVLERGSSGPDDPQYGLLLDIPAVAHIERFAPGDTIRVGTLEMISHATAGHTPGGTSWSWSSCDAGRCVDIVYADSQTPVSADGFRFTDSKTYPAALEDFERGLATLESLPCDILITTHPGANSLWERFTGSGESLVDPQACRGYAARSRQQVRERVNRESEAPERGE